MRSISSILVLFLICSAWPPEAFGQEHGPSVSDELCACVSGLSANTSDAHFQASFRLCLESVVIHHPAQIRAMLKDADPTEQKGYVIGRVLGSLLDRDCPSSAVIKERLRRMNNSTSVL